jgi:hypothetical protein
MRPSSRGLLLTAIFMRPAAQDRTCHDTQKLWNPVPVGWQRNRQVRRRLRDAWCKGHVRTTLVIMWHPLVQQPSSMGLGQRHHDIRACPSQRAEQPSTEGMRLGALRRCPQDPEPQVTHTSVERV